MCTYPYGLAKQPSECLHASSIWKPCVELWNTYRREAISVRVHTTRVLLSMLNFYIGELHSRALPQTPCRRSSITHSQE